MKRTALLILVVCLSCFCACNQSVEDTDLSTFESTAMGEVSHISAEESLPQGDISVLVLGDSIARGYGLKNVTAQRFSTILKGLLEKDFANVTMDNYGVDGMTGAELVLLLEDNTPKPLSNADYVIVSIGANNILRPLQSLSTYEEIFYNRLPEIISQHLFSSSVSIDESQAFNSQELINALGQLADAANSVLDGEEVAQIITDAAHSLKGEISQIMSLIRAENPNCRVYIQTVYNPYKGVKIVIPNSEKLIDMEYFGNKAVIPLNGVIQELASQEGYLVAPVFDRFEASTEDLVNASSDLFNIALAMDPHPNSVGHSLIADIYYNLITEK